MKRAVILILIVIQLVLSGYTPPTIVYFDGYESAEPVHDYADILADGALRYVGEYDVGEWESAELCVYTYIKKEQYHEVFSELKWRDGLYVALFIQADADGNYVGSRIEYKSRGHEGMPDSDTLNYYYLEAEPYLQEGNYEEGTDIFFKEVKTFLKSYTTSEKIQNSKEEKLKHTSYEDRSETTRRFTKAIILLSPVIASFVTALILAFSYTKKLRRQLKTVHESVSALYYLNDEKTRCDFVYEREEDDIWQLI